MAKILNMLMPQLIFVGHCLFLDLELLETHIDTLITSVLENGENFRQDDAPPHFCRTMRDFLDGGFTGP